MTVGGIVRAWREAKGLTLRNLASATGVSPATLMRIEAGAQIQGATLGRLLAGVDQATRIKILAVIGNGKKRRMKRA